MNTLSKTQNNIHQPIGMAGFKRLINEMKAKQFDSIRFAAYRTACKLRYIQQRTRLILLDVRAVVESFRQTGLYLMEPSCNLDRTQIEMMIAQLYAKLSNRLPAGDQLHPNLIPEAIEMLMGWLLYSYDTSGTGRLTVMALKVALSTLASGKPIDKFKYHFTLLTDPSGALIPTRFEQYLHDLLVLAVGVFEGPNFAYNSQASKFILCGRSKAIVIEEFLEKMLADPGPQCLLWLTIFHRLANIENVRHNVRCEGCHREVIIGFRYKCQRCHHYNLCQDCFWTGVTTGGHSNSHDVKEYTSSSKSHSRQFGHALRKSWDRQNNSGGACTGRGMKDYPQNQANNRNNEGNQRLKNPAGQASPCLPYRNTVARIQATDNGQYRSSPNQTMGNNDQNFTGNDHWNQMLMFQHQQHSLDSVSKPHDGMTTGLMSSNSQPLIMTSMANIRDRHFSTASPASVNFAGGGPIPMSHPMVTASSTANWESSLKHSQQQNKDWRQFYHDDEHRLIARYASTLAASRSTHSGLGDIPHSSSSQDTTDAPKIEVHLRSDVQNQNLPTSAKSQKELIMKLEAKNKEILREIQRLRLEQQQNASAVNAATDKSNNPLNNDPVSGSVTNPNLLAELRNLRHRKDELENRMTSLQESRLELMQQLESLMRVLNTSSSNQTSSSLFPSKARPLNQTANTTSTYSRQTGLTGVTPFPSMLPPSTLPPAQMPLHGYGSPLATHRSLSYNMDSSRSGTMGPSSHLPQPRFNTLTRHSRTFSADENLGGYTSQPRRTYTSGNRTLESLGVDTGDYHNKQSLERFRQNYNASKEIDFRQNLLIAADNVTSAMSGLVKELQPSSGSRQVQSQNNSPTSISQGTLPRRDNQNAQTSEYESEYERALDEWNSGKRLQQSTAHTSVPSSVFSNSRISSRILSEQRFLNELRARRQPNCVGRNTSDQNDSYLQNLKVESPPGPAPKGNDYPSSKGVRIAPPPLPPHRTRPHGDGRSAINGNISNYGESDSEAYLYSDPECSLMRQHDDDVGTAMSLGRGREKSVPMENEKLYEIQSLHKKINSLNNGDADKDADGRLHKPDSQNWEETINRWINE